MEDQRRRIRGNLITERLEILLQERGSRQRLLAKLHLLAKRVPQLQDLSEMRLSALSELTTEGGTVTTCPDKLLAAIAYCLRVDPNWLLGLKDDPALPADIRWPWAEDEQNN